MTDLTDRSARYASRPPFCRHGWVTISQNSDLDYGLLLPSDPPSQPMPLLQHRPASRRYSTYLGSLDDFGYLSRKLEAWGSHGRRVPPVATPYHLPPTGWGRNPLRPRKTWEAHGFWAGWEVTSRPSPDPSIPSQSIPGGQVRTACTLSLPRLPHPCPCLVIFCPALPFLCCLPSDTRSQHVDDSYIILGLPPRSDPRSPDGGYNKSRTSRTSFQGLSSSTVFSSVPRHLARIPHCSPVVTAHPTPPNARTKRRHPSPAHLHQQSHYKQAHRLHPLTQRAANTTAPQPTLVSKRGFISRPSPPLRPRWSTESAPLTRYRVRARPPNPHNTSHNVLRVIQLLVADGDPIAPQCISQLVPRRVLRIPELAAAGLAGRARQRPATSHFLHLGRGPALPLRASLRRRGRPLSLQLRIRHPITTPRPSPPHGRR